MSLSIQFMNGKGDSPRNCFSKEFKKNFDRINWGKKESNLSFMRFARKEWEENGWCANCCWWSHKWSDVCEVCNGKGRVRNGNPKN
jgi:hypothetical protein